VVKVPKDPKFRKINLNNDKFHQRVGKFKSAIDIFLTIGFKQKDGFLILEESDIILTRLINAVNLITSDW